MDNKISIRPPIIISIAMLVSALFPLPYGYYTLLRFVICLTAAFLTWNSYKNQKPYWMWGMGLIAVIFNPIIPVYLTRELWIIIDIVVAITFVVYLSKKLDNRK